MRHIRQLRENRIRWLAAGALVAALGWTGVAGAQAQRLSPAVEDLRRALRERRVEAPLGREEPESPDESENRRQEYFKRRAETLDRRIKALDNRAGDLRQALALQDWRDMNEPEAGLVAV